MSILRRVTHILLVASVLFYGAPAWEHSHAAGDQPHDHRAHHDHGDCDHQHGHSHDGISASHAHRHVTLLGLEFTLPLESTDDDGDGGDTVLISTKLSIAIELDATMLSALASPQAEYGPPIGQRPTFRIKAAIAAPLCDTARHERSGVQLI